jgi:hypothetical protein
MMTMGTGVAVAADVFRAVTALGLLVVGSLIVLHMKARLNDRKSLWLQGFVFLITLSAFLGTMSRISTGEPIVWYGAPMRAVATIVGVVYLWKTREDVKDYLVR